MIKTIIRRPGGLVSSSGTRRTASPRIQNGGVNGNGRIGPDAGRVGPQRAVMERRNGLVRPMCQKDPFPFQWAGATIRPGRDLIRPCQSFPSDQFTLWVLDVVSKSFVWRVAEAVLRASSAF